jgi:transcriptional regulator GlxA family with amidase domain
MDPHRVVVLALDRVIPLDFAMPVEVFGGSSGLPYQVRVCAPGPTVRTTVGFRITPDSGLAALARADTVVVPGFEPHDEPLSPAVLTSLRRAHARGARMISICVGAFALAQAGVLDGRPATTHWQNTAELAERYPTVEVRPDVLYVDDGDVLTSAGVSSGLDLCLHVLRKDLGAATARGSRRRSWPRRTVTVTRPSSSPARSRSTAPGRSVSSAHGSRRTRGQRSPSTLWPRGARCPPAH